MRKNLKKVVEFIGSLVLLDKGEVGERLLGFYFVSSGELLKDFKLGNYMIRFVF